MGGRGELLENGGTRRENGDVGRVGDECGRATVGNASLIWKSRLGDASQNAVSEVFGGIISIICL